MADSALDMIFKRGALPWPPGDNDTDTFIDGVHYNKSTLEHFNYTLYSNNTLSNHSKCRLTFHPYQPVYLFPNGTFINSTNCYSAIDPIEIRGYVGIGFAVAFGISLVLNITALAKHGKLFLPKERRFYPIGRRWQWYWGCFICAMALVSLLTNVDVDRYYLPELPAVLNVFFYYLMCMGTAALVWEAVRHWGSWQERQYVDPNPFIYAQDDKRAKVEFYLPLWTYLWIWLNFFLVIPRSWTFAEQQRSQEQTEAIAIPNAQGAKFIAGGACLGVALLTACFSLYHSVQHYQPRHRGIVNRVQGCVTAVPLRLLLLVILLGATVAYQLAITQIWDISIVNINGSVPVIYGWGYGPSLLILLIQVAYGYFSPNEDRELIRQRRERGEMLDRELGLVKKPAWWRRVRGDHIVGDMRDRIFRNVNEVGGGRGAGRRAGGDMETDMERHIREAAMHAVLDDDIELHPMNDSDDNPRVDRAGAKGASSVTWAYGGPSVPETHVPIVGHFSSRHDTAGGNAPPPYEDGRSRGLESMGAGQRTSSTSTTGSTNAPPQQIRSMLDI